MTDTNIWTTRQQAYDVVYKYPSAFGITRFTWDPNLWYIVTRDIENGKTMYRLHGSDCIIEIDPDDLQATRCFDTLYEQMNGNAPADAAQYVQFSDLAPIPV